MNAKMLKTNFNYDKYIAVSKFQKQYSIIHEGINKNKIDFLYNPIDTDKYTSRKMGYVDIELIENTLYVQNKLSELVSRLRWETNFFPSTPWERGE